MDILSNRHTPSFREATAHFAAKPHYLQLLALLAVVYAYVFVQLFKVEWSEPESAHGPLILGLALWLLYRRWDEKNLPTTITAGRGAVIVVFYLIAAAMFLVGVIGQIAQLAYGSIVPFLLASILLYQGKASLGLLLPALFVCFSIPFPGFIVDPVTLPMKQLVAYATEGLLRAFDYPVARSGVVLYIDPYELQVADACAGLRTMLTLETLGLLYMSLLPAASTLRKTLLALLVFPISIAANTIRVTLLCLITYYFGEAAGQGFLHEFAGMVLFACALALLLASDAAVQALSKRRAAV